jgi:hypothetical protein
MHGWIHEYGCKVIRWGCNLRSQRKRMGDLKGRIHGQSFREIRSTAIESKVGQMCG